MHRIPEPNVRDLLLPLLSCLPAAFLAPRPPPALLPLLSPILRQRVHLRSSNTIASAIDPSSSASNWLSLLTWSSSKAADLVEVCSNLLLEPHPVSGELELFGDASDENAGKAYYRRLDVETLQACCDVREHGLSVTWIWCESDTGSVGLPGEDVKGEAQSGWRVADVQPLDVDDLESHRRGPESGWYMSLDDAEEAYASYGAADGRDARTSLFVSSNGNTDIHATRGATSDAAGDDDDYWASYDRTPDQTPNKSPAPPTPRNASFSASNLYNPSRDRQPSTNMEAEYYARYGSVQPAMDGHDPDEEEGASAFQSTLGQGYGGNRVGDPPEYDMINYTNGPNGRSLYDQAIPPDTLSGDSGVDEPPIVTPAHTVPLRIHSPTPSRPSSSGSSGGRRSPVDKLEASANSASVAEIGVKQHISTEMKSLYRLARAAGIERDEFERVIKTELAVLDLVDI